MPKSSIDCYPFIRKKILVNPSVADSCGDFVVMFPSLSRPGKVRSIPARVTTGKLEGDREDPGESDNTIQNPRLRRLKDNEDEYRNRHDSSTKQTHDALSTQCPLSWSFWFAGFSGFGDWLIVHHFSRMNLPDTRVGHSG